MMGKGATKSAHLIRYYKDNKIEEDKEKGIVRGRAQLTEDELVALFDYKR